MAPSGASAEGSTGGGFPNKGGPLPGPLPGHLPGPLPGPLPLERLHSNQSALASLGQLLQRQAGIVNSDPAAGPSAHVTVGEGPAPGEGGLVRMQSVVGSVTEPLPQGRAPLQDTATLPRDPVTVSGARVTVEEDADRGRPPLERLQSCNKSGVASSRTPAPWPPPWHRARGGVRPLLHEPRRQGRPLGTPGAGVHRGRYTSEPAGRGRLWHRQGGRGWLLLWSSLAPREGGRGEQRHEVPAGMRGGAHLARSRPQGQVQRVLQGCGVPVFFGIREIWGILGTWKALQEAQGASSD